MRQSSILIVDDERPILNLLGAIFSHRYRCTMAESGQEAMELLKADSFDLLISDLLMPGISGIDLCQFVRGEFPQLPIVVISGIVELRHQVEAMQLGVFSCVPKPFNIPQLVSIVGNALSRDVIAA